MGKKSSFARTLFLGVDYLFDPSQNWGKASAEGLTIEKDIVYDNSNPFGKLDVYYKPKAEGTYPVFFYVHGGGFVAGDKKYRRALSKTFAQMGYLVVNINYALAPEYVYPTGLNQCYRALEWLGANAEKYKGDLDRVVIGGDSAGGYYAAHLAAVANNPLYHERVGYNGSVKIAGAILNCGLYDIEQALSNKIMFNLQEKLCFDLTGEAPDLLTKNPSYDIISPAKLLNEDFPRSFVIYAEKDMFCAGFGEAFSERLRSLNVPCEVYFSTKSSQNHCWCLSPSGKAAKACNAKVYEFAKTFVK